MNASLPEDDALAGLDHDELVGLVRRLVSIVEDLQAENARLADENARLRHAGDRDSTNSGMPPSTDDAAAREKRARQRKKVTPKRRQGKQPGDSGHTLARVDDPDETVLWTPSACGCCGADLADAEVVGHQSRQVFDVPEPKPTVTDHVAETRRCGCGHKTTAPFPPEARGPACWGPTVRALAVYLVVGQHLPYGRAAEVLTELCGTAVSVGTVVNIVEEIATALAVWETTVTAMLRLAAVCHFDETGAKVGSGTNRHHVHVASTALLTLLVLHKNRGRQAMADIAILEHFGGTAVHDGYARYWDYSDCTHAKCGAHLLRNLESVADVDSQAAWANALAGLLREANIATHDARERGDPHLDPSIRHSIRTRYGRLIAAGYRANPDPAGRKRDVYEKEAYNLVVRLDTYRDDVLRFIDDLAVPFTNNTGERDLRPVKLHANVSNLWRTTAGAKAWCRTRSYISTLRKNNQPVLDGLRNAITGTPWTPTAAW